MVTRINAANNFDNHDRSEPTASNSGDSLLSNKLLKVRSKIRSKTTRSAIALATLPLLATTGIIYATANHSLSQQASESYQQKTQELASGLAQFMAERYSDIQAIADSPMLTNPQVGAVTDSASQQAGLKQLLKTYQVYDNIAIFNVNGSPIVQTGKEPLPNQKDNQYFQQVLQTKQPVVSQPVQSGGSAKVHLMAVVREGSSQTVVGVVQASLPVSVIEARLQAAGNTTDQYQVFDATGKFFIAEPAERLERSARTDFPQLEWSRKTPTGSTAVIKDQLSQQTNLVSYAPLPSPEGLPDLQWGVIAETNASNAFGPQQSLMLQFLIGGGLTALLAGAVAAWLANRATKSLLKTVQLLQQVTNGKLDSRLVVQGDDEFAMVGNAINQIVDQMQTLQLEQAESAKRTRLVAELTSNIRQTLDFDTILRTSVEGLRQILNVDRTVIYRFNPDFKSGEITAESVHGSWARALGQTIHDPLLPDSVARYRSGRVTMVENLETADLSRCHCEILESLDVKANIVAPILVGEELVGLICAHQCSGPRSWHEAEVELIQQISTQIGYALGQAALLKQQSNAAARERQQSIIVSQMRELLDEETILQVAVRETRAVLASDRVIVYMFDEKWAGTIVAESVDRQFPAALNTAITDPCFAQGYVKKYKEGRVQATNDILEAGLTECHMMQLKPFGVRANLVAPILVNNQLKGLFVAHQCDGPRMWTELDINFMRQVAIQLGFALEQAASLKLQSDTVLLERQQSAIVLQMRESLDEETILQVAVRETRAALASDRIIVYMFDEDWSGTVVAESVDYRFPAALGAEITDPCFAQGYIGKYKQGRVQATNNILEAGLTECHLMQLKPFAVQANLVAPILVNDQLKGLFVAHQCSGPRAWTELDINFMGRMAIQLGFALEQSDLAQRQLRGAEQAHQLKEIMVSMRQSLKREDIYTTTVDKLRYALKADRVVLYQFNPDWTGTVIAESVATGWRKILNQTVTDPFREGLMEEYRNGRVRFMNDVAAENIADCHRDILEGFEIRASVVTPILRQGELLGLVSVHQCSGPRSWQQEEVNLVAQLSTQLTFALEQADLFEEKEKARLQAEAISREQSRQREALQMQLIGLLSDVEGVAQGDLTVRADVTAGDIGTVADFFNSIVENLRQIVTQVKVSANQVNLSLGENEGAMRHLAEEALQQAEETTHTLDSVEEMTRSIQAVAVSAQQAATVARKASTTAEAGEDAIARTVQNILNLRETVGETAKKVKRLGESSQQISKVVSLINQIAMQTNLLAINAGIEAARAGEEGQGFAVVAEEVGELAARSAAATQEIEKIVENIQRETGQVVEAMEQSTAQVVEGTHLVDDAKQSLHQILDVSREIDQLVQSISDATVSQVETSESVSRLMKQIAQVSERTSDSSRQVSSSLRETVAVAQELQASVGTFKVDSDG